MNLLSTFLEDKKISPVTDPFTKDCITAIHTHMMKQRDGKFSISGSVEFTNGSTEGKQKFNADDFGALVKSMESFIEKL